MTCYDLLLYISYIFLPFTCLISFFLSHARLHTGQKPYSCSQCHKVFRTISHRKTHMLSHAHSPLRQANTKKYMALPNIPLQEPILITTAGCYNVTLYLRLYDLVDFTQLSSCYNVFFVLEVTLLLLFLFICLFIASKNKNYMI